MDNATKDPDVAAVDAAIDSLVEHFDWVHIFAGRYEGDKNDSVSVVKGTGDWHARIGRIAEWMTYQDELLREQARADFENEPDDEE